MAWDYDETIGSGKTHTGINDFFNDHEDDTFSADGARGTCYGVVSSANVYFAGWQAGQSESCKVVIEAASGEETDFVLGSGGAEINGRLSAVQNTNAGYLHIYNLEMSTGDGNWFVEVRNLANITMINCLCNHIDAGKSFADLLSTTGVYLRMGGCLVIGNPTANSYTYGLWSGDPDAVVDLINCTFVDIGGTAVRVTGGVVNSKNCAVVDCANDFNGITGDTTNLSENDGDVTDDDADDFTKPSTADYHVYDTDSALYQAGTAVVDAWFAALCTTDIDGTAWAETPSVGCYEFSMAAGDLNINVHDCGESVTCLV